MAHPREEFQSRLPKAPDVKPLQSLSASDLNVGEKRKAPVKPESVKAPLAKRPTRASLARGPSKEDPTKDKNAETWEDMVEAGMDVEQLLATKMTGKGKFDYKGKSEQMSAYIKQLRACVKYLAQVEENMLEEKAALEENLAKEESLRQEEVDTMKRKHSELEGNLSELQAGLQKAEDRLESEQAKTVAAAEENRAARADGDAAKAEAAELRKDLARAEGDAESLKKQVEETRELSRRAQEYTQSLQEYNTKMQADLEEARANALALEKSKAQLEGEAAALKSQGEANEAKLEAAQAGAADAAGLRAELERARSERAELDARLAAAEKEVDEFRAATGQSAGELAAISNKASALEQSFTSQAELVEALKRDLEIERMKVETAERSAGQRGDESAALSVKVDELQAALEDTERRCRDGELQRRKLHNTILELKGNIRVFCRVRPSIEEDAATDASDAPPPIAFPQGADLEGRGIELQTVANGQKKGDGQKYAFNYDRVFAPRDSQEEVFGEISQLVQSALDGYKVCIFAYGQTGSGKTHTMIGSDGQGQEGMIPRSLKQIFESCQAMREQGWSYTMKASMLEIYNEEYKDLLSTKAPAKGHQVKHDAHGGTEVTDLTLVDVSNQDQVEALLERATQSRSVARTNLNDRSSRSHCVFTLRLYGRNEGTQQEASGVLNLIDLAGSERLSRSGATGDRLKETQAINKSLSALGDVISSLAAKDKHVPYRNSKLTYLLQPCLGGDAKTLMFVNVSPAASSAGETLCSLRFAAKVNACDVGTAKRQTGPAGAAGGALPRTKSSRSDASDRMES